MGEGGSGMTAKEDIKKALDDGTKIEKVGKTDV